MKHKSREVTFHLPRKLNPQALLRNFLDGYDYLSWMNRIVVLDMVITQPDLCNKVQSASQSVLGEIGSNLTGDRIVNAAKLETHFAAYHSTEALLGMLFAFVYDPNVPWIWLTKYDFHTFGELVSKLAREGFSMFNSDEEKRARALFAFKSTEPNSQKAIDESVKFAIAYLQALASHFKDKDDYNSYKHGLRTLIPQEFKMQLAQVKWAELVTTYLVLGKPFQSANHWVSDLSLVFKAIDYKKSERIIVTNTRLMHNILEIRKAMAYGRTQLSLHVFETETVADIFKPSKEGNVMNTFKISPGPLNQVDRIKK